jgi:hypothetical protein
MNKMGGSSGGPFLPSDVQKLEERAKQKLQEASVQTSRHVFISFAYEDIDEVNLLRGQAKNENVDLAFDDHSVKEAFDSKDADYIKRRIREKIDRASVTLVYLSNNSAKSPWIDWEIRESYKRGKGVIGLYKGDTPPPIIPSAIKENGGKIVKWAHVDLMKAIEECSRKR